MRSCHVTEGVMQHDVPGDRGDRRALRQEETHPQKWTRTRLPGGERDAFVPNHIMTVAGQLTGEPPPRGGLRRP